MKIGLKLGKQQTRVLQTSFVVSEKIIFVLNHLFSALNRHFLALKDTIPDTKLGLLCCHLAYGITHPGIQRAYQSIFIHWKQLLSANCFLECVIYEVNISCLKTLKCLPFALPVFYTTGRFGFVGCELSCKAFGLQKSIIRFIVLIC